MKDRSASSYNRIVDTPAIVRLLIWINISSCMLIGALFWIAGGWQVTTLSLLLMAAVSALLLGLHRLGHSQLAGFLLYLLVSSVISFNISIGQGIYDEAMLVYPVMIVFSGLLFGKRSAVLVTGISVGQISLIYLFAEAGVVRPFDGAVQMRLEETITSLVIILVTGYLVWLVIELIERAVERIQESESRVEDAYHQTLIAWAKALELRRREDPGHSVRVSSLACLFAEFVELPPDQVRAVKQGSLLHDIGKMGIPEALLHKKESHNPDEKKQIQSHTRLGVELIQDIEYLAGARQVVAWHHERFDGKGYPDHLQGDQIPRPVQIFSVADCWDSLRTEQPCRSALSDEEALDYIQDQSGKKFSPEVVGKFLELVNFFGLLERR